MSKKDYIAIAAVLKELRQESPVPLDWDTIIDALAWIFYNDNPRFNLDKFRRACSQ